MLAVERLVAGLPRLASRCESSSRPPPRSGLSSPVEANSAPVGSGRSGRQPAGGPCRSTAREWRSPSAAPPSRPRSRAARRGASSRTRSELSSSSSCLSSGAKLEAARDRERQLGRLGGGALDVASPSARRAREEGERPLDVGRLRRVVLVVERLDAGRSRTSGRPSARAPGTARRPRRRCSSRPSSNRSVTSADGRQRPDLAEAVVVGVDDAERRPLLEALADQLRYRGSKMCSGTCSVGQQHEPQREQADLHRPKPTRADPGNHSSRVSGRRLLASMTHARGTTV